MSAKPTDEVYMSNLLAGKRAVITGCNRGIGKAILEVFAGYGADVFAVIRHERPEFTAYCDELLKKTGVTIDIVYADFSDEEQVKAAAKEIAGTKIPIDVLVNNIGIANPLAMFTMTKMETVRKMFDISFFSGLTFTQMLAKRMMKNKAGSIVFLSSSAAYDAGANLEYTAVKSAIIGATKRLAREFGNYGIRVNAVAPGLTSTDMGNSMSEEDEKIALEMNVMKRKGEPVEIADVVAFLASDMSRFMTGQCLRVDGGLIG